MMDSENLEGALQELARAIDNHEQWHKELTRTIICRLPHDLRDVADDAHRQCRFGQWYYGSVAPELRAHAVFAAMEVAHERMHRFAAELLKSSTAGSLIAPDDYDRFANVIDHLRREIHALQRELEESLVHHD
jgi:diguanylate cyclase